MVLKGDPLKGLMPIVMLALLVTYVSEGWVNHHHADALMIVQNDCVLHQTANHIHVKPNSALSFALID